MSTFEGLGRNINEPGKPKGLMPELPSEYYIMNEGNEDEKEDIKARFEKEKQELIAITKNDLNLLNEEVSEKLYSIEYDKEVGVIVNLNLDLNEDGSSSFLFDSRVSEKEKALLAGMGLKIGNNCQLLGFAEGINQNMDSTCVNSNTSQIKAGICFKIKVNKPKTFKNIELGATRSSSYGKISKASGSQQFTSTQQSDPEKTGKFLGAEETKAFLKTALNIGDGGELEIKGGIEQLKYDGMEAENRYDTSIRYTQFMSNYELYGEMMKRKGETGVGAGIKGNIDLIKGATWTLDGSHTVGSQGETRVMAGINIPFGGGDLNSQKYVRDDTVQAVSDNLSTFAYNMRSDTVISKEADNDAATVVADSQDTTSIFSSPSTPGTKNNTGPLPSPGNGGRIIVSENTIRQAFNNPANAGQGNGQRPNAGQNNNIGRPSGSNAGKPPRIT